MWPGYWICKAFPSQSGRPSIFSSISLLMNYNPHLTTGCPFSAHPLNIGTSLILILSFFLLIFPCWTHSVLGVYYLIQTGPVWWAHQHLIYRGPSTQKHLMLGALMLCGCRFKFLITLSLNFCFICVVQWNNEVCLVLIQSCLALPLCPPGQLLSLAHPPFCPTQNQDH